MPDYDADYFTAAALAESATATTSTLCCCEYVAADRRRSHVIGCLCNCEDFDLVCTRLVTCQRIEQSNINGMLIAFQDRLRIPWRGGAKRISPAALAPAFILPLMIGLAAINAKTGIVIIITLVGFAMWTMSLAVRTASRTTFFLSWNVFSIIYIVIIFEFEVPLLELLPEENYILVLLASVAIYCLLRAKQLAPLNHVTAQYGSTPKDELPGIAEASSGEEQAEQQAHEAAAAQVDCVLGIENDEQGYDKTGERLVLINDSQPNICEICRKYTPPRSHHCDICGSCIKQRNHHSFFLNCCIGERNFLWYWIGMVLAEFALLLSANLILTAVCHPFLVVRLLGIPLLLPDDCSEVFEDYQLGISFVIAVYAFLIAAYIIVRLGTQSFLRLRGISMFPERRRNRRPSSWRAFFK